jgi:hypothetical protein
MSNKAVTQMTDPNTQSGLFGKLAALQRLIGSRR